MFGFGDDDYENHKRPKHLMAEVARWFALMERNNAALENKVQDLEIRLDRANMKNDFAWDPLSLEFLENKIAKLEEYKSSMQQVVRKLIKERQELHHRLMVRGSYKNED